MFDKSTRFNQVCQLVLSLSVATTETPAPLFIVRI